MVSLWPWKGEDNSPASFEKALSALAAKISQSQTHLDSLRTNNRRFVGLWTIYSIFAYLLCAIILFLVVGWPQWTAVEYTAVAGSPLIIILVRTGITAYYNYRISNAINRLEEQQKARTKTIDKLKAATKYNSTQELLEKYGGAPPKPKKENKAPPKPKVPKQVPGRVGAGPPPPTANINRPEQIPSQPSTPQPQLPPQPQFPQIQFHNGRSPSPFNPPTPIPAQPQRPTEEFAPNAYSSPPTYATGPEPNIGGNWYDRVLDLLMGEDETSPKNRVALICQNCRLVNGQAPPGTKSLSDLGRWRCFGCGGWNGEEDEAAKAVKEMKERIETAPEITQEVAVEDEELTREDDEAGKEDEEMEKTPSDSDSVKEMVEVQPAKRGRPKGSRKKT